MEGKTLEKKWYIIHTYSGYEKKVMTDLEKRIESLNLTEKVFNIIVPEEETVEIRRGKKKVIARKLFPGYVMVEMLVEKEVTNEGIGFRVDSDAWYVIRNTNGVTGFVGVGSEPTPMEDSEVQALFKKIGLKLGPEEIEEKAEKIVLNFEVGDFVKIIDGGFADEEGKVANIDFEHKRVKVMIEMFGRMTPVEVGFDGVKKA
ncbi:MAG: transcription termination/antitermination factor NusG [Fusobacteriaceae bacterium]|jgi:transcription termination/antitermination factor NusG|nr:transcription termination/antitermination factor NusG [Fusobacteriaceae bacterium]MBP6467633.1 transcription termination/antitermination factor NusG [Fusobacteriaceae bacterium]MBP9595768.1 transcription termination/antitermination factor NusG [Fusobacteriaceae bacterium]MBU9918290.1 transcription termination/antitermination protein NusG [Fusobacteriaceae bacterium]